MRSSTLLALAASISSSAAVYQGFNYGATKSDGSFQYQADYDALFQTAKNLVGTSGFTSARLYTMIQGGSSTNEPTQAIPAAIAQDTSLLLGLWASGGQDGINAELIALNSAIQKWGSQFTNLVAGISVGSEDLYRISPTGIAANSGYGADPDTLVNYINQVRSALKGTALSGAPIGHVDTWTAWVNGSNSAVAAASDWVGMDAYPYFQNTMANSEADGPGLFNDAFAATKAAVGGKPVWITETGWPVSGKTENLAVPSIENAKAYWDAVACPNLGVVNTWWFTIQDAAPTTPNPSFGIVGSTLSTTPLYDLSCKDVSSSSSTAPSSTSSASATSSPSSSASSTVVGGGSGSSVTSSIESGASSVASAASTSVLVSSGGGLSPTQGGGGLGGAGGSSVSQGTGPNPSTASGTTSGSISSPTSVLGGSGPSANSSSTGSGTTVAVSTPTGSTGGNSSVIATQTIKSSGSATGSASTSTSSVVTANGANLLTGSVAGAVGVVVAAVMAL